MPSEKAVLHYENSLLFVKRIAYMLLFIIAGAWGVFGHDLFLKLDTYFLPPKTRATVRLLNGTFQMSDGIVRRERLRDARIVLPGGTVERPFPEQWRDEAKMTLLDIETKGEGTYVIGVSTLPREIELRAREFNEYLAHDGLPDMLAERRRRGELNKDVRERYSKHVRAIFQVGDRRTDDYKTALGYPVEIIPISNPYELRPGQTLEVIFLKDGKPVANQFMLAGYELNGKLSQTISTRTDRDGIARFRLTSRGKWYVKTIHMTRASEPNLDYESKWATLTFELR